MVGRCDLRTSNHQKEDSQADYRAHENEAREHTDCVVSDKLLGSVVMRMGVHDLPPCFQRCDRKFRISTCSNILLSTSGELIRR